MDFKIQYKQFVIIPTKPRMSAGKVASQTAHATFMALERQRQTKEGRALIARWKSEGLCVIVLTCKTQVELMNIAHYCEQWNVPGHLYIDEGFTEIPMGTATAFATGVMPATQHWMLSQLRLL